MLKIKLLDLYIYFFKFIFVDGFLKLFNFLILGCIRVVLVLLDKFVLDEMNVGEFLWLGDCFELFIE